MEILESMNGRILILAEQCKTFGTGEGWQNFKWCEAISHKRAVTLVTTRNRHEALLRTRLPNVDVVCLGHPGVDTTQEFYKKARLWLVEQLRRGETFSFGHQLTSNVCEYPSPLIGLSIPYIVGPLGLCGTGEAFERSELSSAKVEALLTRLENSPLVLNGLRQAAVVLVAEAATKNLLKRFGLNSVVIEPRSYESVAPRGACPSMAAGHVRILHADLHNSSNETQQIRQAMTRIQDLSGVSVRSFSVGDRRLTMDQQRHSSFKAVIKSYLEETDLLIVSNETLDGEIERAALRKGIPVMTINRDDDSNLVDNSCGVLVSGAGDELVASIEKQIRRIHDRPFLLTPLRSGARKKAREISVWRGSLATMEKLYERIMRCSDSLTVPAVSY